MWEPEVGSHSSFHVKRIGCHYANQVENELSIQKLLPTLVRLIMQKMSSICMGRRQDAIGEDKLHLQNRISRHYASWFSGGILKLILVRGGYLKRKNQGFDNKQIHIRRAQEVSESYHLIPCMRPKIVVSRSPYPLVMARKGRTWPTLLWPILGDKVNISAMYRLYTF